MAGGIIGSILGGVLTGGAGPAIGAGIGAAIPSVAEIARTITERLVPDPVKRAEAEAAIASALAAREAAVMQAITEQNAAQSSINLAEAQGNDRFSSRWRPAAAWVCVAGFAYQFVFAPVMTWMAAIIGTALAISFPVPPTLSTGDLMPVLLGLLGLGAQRSYERVNGVPGAIPGGPQTAGHR